MIAVSDRVVVQTKEGPELGFVDRLIGRSAVITLNKCTMTVPLHKVEVIESKGMAGEPLIDKCNCSESKAYKTAGKALADALLPFDQTDEVRNALFLWSETLARVV